MSGVFNLELYDAPDPELLSDDEAAWTEIDTAEIQLRLVMVSGVDGLKFLPQLWSNMGNKWS